MMDRTLSISGTWKKRLGTAAMAATMLATLTGCPDSQARLDEFDARYKVANPSSGSGAGGMSAFMCDTPPTATGELDGKYLFALSAELGPDTPILFDTTVTTADGLTFSMSLQPLRADDRMTPVGSPIDIGPFDLDASGGFAAALPPLDVPPEANAISGTAISAEVTMTGGFCLPADSLCGTIVGALTQPFAFDLTSSTFTMTKVASAAEFPEPPPINCAGDLAKPLSEL